MKVTQSCPTLWPHGLYSPWNSPGQNTGVGGLSLLQGIFPTQGSNPGFTHCRWILYQLSHKGSPKWCLGQDFLFFFLIASFIRGKEEEWSSQLWMPLCFQQHWDKLLRYLIFMRLLWATYLPSGSYSWWNQGGSTSCLKAYSWRDSEAGFNFDFKNRPLSLEVITLTVNVYK